MERQQLPPGFRFHPTDEELVLQYLRRKAFARPLPAAVIPVVHAAALPDPWDLPGASQGEAAYFFSLRQARAGGRRRRAASGYWKATGKEKPVFVRLQGPSGSGNGKRLLVGVKSALAFHRGKGKASLTRTGWVMHEYRLAATPSDSQSCEWVVCRVSLKKNRAARRPSAGDVGSERTAAVHREDGVGNHNRPSSPSSSCVTDTCTLQITEMKSAAVLSSSSINTMPAPSSSCMLLAAAPCTTVCSRPPCGPRSAPRRTHAPTTAMDVRVPDERQRRHAADTGSNHVWLKREHRTASRRRCGVPLADPAANPKAYLRCCTSRTRPA